MKNVVLIIFILSLFVTLAQDELIKLEKAYKSKSQSQLKEFLQDWHDESIPISSLDSLSDVQKDVYQIYYDFYNPFNLKRIGKGEWGEELYSKIQYVIIQSKIYVNTYKTDSLNFNYWEDTDSLVLSRDSILDFRPDLKFNQAKTLFLFPKYNIAIDKFLESKHKLFGSDGKINRVKPRDNSENRLKFLNDYFLIIDGHKSVNWHINTHPEVFNIEFNEDRTRARVNFQLLNRGGEAIYTKINGEWKMENAILTWIK